MSRTAVERHKTPEERRSEASKVGRELIRETVTLVYEQTRRYLGMPELTQHVLRDNEPVIDRLVLISDPRLLTRPRVWVKDLLATLSASMLVDITIVTDAEPDGLPRLKITGRWSDVQLAELTVQRAFLLASEAATYAYRTAYRGADGQRERRKLRGARKRWLNHFVMYLKAALGHTYERLAEEHGVDALRTVVKELPVPPTTQVRRITGKAVATSGR